MTATKTTSVKAQSIILVGEEKNSNDDKEHFIEFNNAQSKVEKLRCSDSFFAMAKQVGLTRDKTHTYTLYLNSQGEVYNYDKTLKPAYRFMSDEDVEKEQKSAAGDASSMILTYDRDTGEVNILRPFASVTDDVKAKIIDHVVRDIDELRADDVLPGGLLITEIRDRGAMKTFYIQK